MKIIKITSESISKMEYPKKLEEECSSDLLSQYVHYVQAKTSVKAGHVKTRAEVRGGGKKPWRQKGTGRARHGSIRSPIWVGGGVTFGPNAKQRRELRMNKKMRKKAYKAMMSLLAKNNQLAVAELKEEDKKQIRKQIEKASENHRSKILVFKDRQESSLIKATNLKNSVTIALDRFGAKQMLGKDIIIFDKPAFDELTKRLS